MKNTKNIFWKAENGSMKTVAVIGAICIALMLSVGITVAQQIQEQKSVSAISKTSETDCVYCTPQKPSGGGMRAEGHNYVCPLAMNGISEIQALGESWYEDQIATGEVIYVPFQNMTQPRGINVIFKTGFHGLSLPVGGYYTFPLTWAQLTERFAVVQAFDAGTGPRPYWWTDAENITFTSIENCATLGNCLIQNAGVDPYLVYILTGFIVVDGSPYYYVPLIIEGAPNQQMAIQCLHNAGVI